MEIERRFLIHDPPADLGTYEREPIRQGYVGITREGRALRLRQRGSRCWLTVKGDGDVEREEWETEIDAEQFDSLWPATAERRLTKTRYVIPRDEGHPIELDIFGPPVEGLMLAEVEFDSLEEARAFEAPEWFGAEVSDDPAYRNRALAMKGQR